MSAFVGEKTVSSPEDLKRLLDQYADDSDYYYFLRWPHKVSGFQKQIPSDFPSPEGQMFNQERELRWKQQGEQFSVLVLSTQTSESGFKLVGEAWESQKWNAHIYPPTETQFPKGIADSDVDIAQRYFLDKHTSTVHFVALTVK